METADKGRDHMTVFRVIIISSPINVRWHHGNKVGSVLAPVGLAELDACDLCDRIPLVRWFEGTSEKFLLGYGLLCKPGVNAGRAQKQKLFCTDPVGAVDQIGGDHEILVDEFSRKRIVRVNATHFRGRHHDDVRSDIVEEVFGGLLAQQIDLFPTGCYDLAIDACQSPHNGRANHAAMTRYEYPLAFQIVQFGRNGKIIHCGHAVSAQHGYQ